MIATQTKRSRRRATRTALSVALDTVRDNAAHEVRAPLEQAAQPCGPRRDPLLYECGKWSHVRTAQHHQRERKVKQQRVHLTSRDCPELQARPGAALEQVPEHHVAQERECPRFLPSARDERQ